MEMSSRFGPKVLSKGKNKVTYVLPMFQTKKEWIEEFSWKYFLELLLDKYETKILYRIMTSYTMPKRCSNDGRVFPYTDDRGVRRRFAATGNVYRRQPSHASLVTAAAMTFRNQDVTGTPWSDEPAPPFSPCSVRSRLPATDFSFNSHQI
jgi:hypothetical protein